MNVKLIVMNFFVGIIVVIVFVWVIFIEGCKFVVVGMNVMDLCCGIIFVVDVVVVYLKS